MAARTTQVESATSPGIMAKPASQADVPHPVVPPPLCVPALRMQPRQEIKRLVRLDTAVELTAALAAIQLVIPMWRVTILAEPHVSRLLIM